MSPIEMSERMRIVRFFKHAFQMYKNDWKRVMKSPMAILMAVALIILPCFYAWFNIKALWDPYSNTGSLPVAVYSADKTETLQTLGKKITLNIGDEVVANLKKNDDIDWKFVDNKSDLVDGVQSGKYYAGIYVPKNFSSNLTSFLNGKIKKPDIEYYVNQKINAIAPKITDKGAGSIQATITDEFISTVSKTIVGTANKVGIDLDSHMMDLTKVKNLFLYADENLDEMDQLLNEVVQLNQKMPTIESKMTDASSFVQTTIPKLDELTQKVEALNNSLPAIKEKMAPILTVQSKIPEIKEAGKQIKAVDENFSKVESTMNGAIEDAEQGLSVIHQTQKILPELDQMLSQTDTFIDHSSDAVKQLQTALPKTAESVNTSLALIQTISAQMVTVTNDLGSFIKNNELTKEDKEHIATLVTQLNSQLSHLSQMMQSTSQVMNNIDEATGSQALARPASSLMSAKQVADDMQNHLAIAKGSVEQLSTDRLMSMLKNINTLGQRLTKMTQSIDVSSIATQLNQLTSELQTTLSQAKTVTGKVKQLDVASLLTNTEKTLNEALSFVKEVKKNLPAVKQEVHDANELINGNMSTIVGAINKGASFYNDGFPMVQSKLGEAEQFMTTQLPTIENELQQTMETVQSKMPMIDQALSVSSSLIEGEWPQLKKGIKSVAKKLRDGQNNVDMKDFMKLLKLNAEKEANFMKEPVKIHNHNIYPVPNYGSQSAPFYTVLCLWVGGLLSVSLLSVEPYFGRLRRKEDKHKASQLNTTQEQANDIFDEDAISFREAYVGKLLVFLSFAAVQSFAVTLGNFFILDVYAVNKGWYFLFTFITSFTFMSIIYTVVALFKDVGKAMAVIILVLSISGGGGNFPIQLSGPFFQAIYPFLPFTYAVNLVRESTGGIYWPNATYDIFILLLFAIGFLVIGITLCPYMEKPMKRIEESVEHTHFFS